MCDPGSIALASLAIGAATSATSASAANADYAAKSASWQQNVVNSEAAGRDEQKQIIGNQLADQAKTDQQLQVSQLSQAEKSAQYGVQAAEGGVSGVSVDNVLNDIAGKSEVNRTYADENYKFVVADTQEHLTSSTDQTQSRINQDTIPQSPSPLTPILGIAGAGLKAETTYKTLSAGGGSSSGD